MTCLFRRAPNNRRGADRARAALAAHTHQGERVSEIVPADQIEAIVGVKRHPTEHHGRAVSAEQTVYILHSQQCRDTTPDLRTCRFSVALDRGIENAYPWTGWRRVQDQAVRLEISRGWLMPDFDMYAAAMRAAAGVAAEEATDATT